MSRPRRNAGGARSTYLRVVPWILVAAYTIVLPEAIVVYRAIVGAFGKLAAGRAPLLIVLVLGLAYGAAVLFSHRSWRNLLYLVPAAIISFLIMRLEDNPNKHVHIPEYALAAWLLFAALARDYKGKGLFVLIVVYGTLLGVVDELEQGIHPLRYYGLSDMVVNSASTLIGVFTIMGLTPRRAGGWKWSTHLKRFRPLIATAVFGIVGILLACIYLFEVQANPQIHDAYPDWLFVVNLVYLLWAPVAAYRGGALGPRHARRGANRARALPAAAITARLWIIPLLVILFYMHALAAYVAASGMEFR
jgi:hypothetical protein